MTKLQAQLEVDECKRACREAYDLQGSTHPLHIFWQCHEYHRRCQLLREAEERLRSCHSGVTTPANDTSSEVA